MKQKKKQTVWSGILVFGIYILVGAGCGGMVPRLMEALPPVPGGLFTELLLDLAVFYVAFLLIIYAQIIVHEGGHLVFGLLSGYRFLSFRVGSLMLMRTTEGMRLRRLSLAGTGGQCLMAPPELQDGTMPFVLYNLGGTLMNVISAALLWGLSLLCPGTAASVLLRMAAVIGLAFAATNGIPLSLKAVDNDGCNIRAMRRDPTAVRAFWVQLRVNEEAAAGVRTRDMPEAWFRLPEDADLQNGLVSAWAVLAENRLMDEGRFEEADEAARSLLEGEARVAGILRMLLICDRMTVCVLRGEDPGALDTKEQRKLMQSMRRFPPVLRTQAALALRAGDRKQAEQALAQFEKTAARYPNPADILSERDILAALAQRYPG